MSWVLWLPIICSFGLQTSAQDCTDPTNPAVSRLYNRECTADTVTIRTALPLTLKSGDAYGRNLVVYGKQVTLAANLTNYGREVTIVAETIGCGEQATTISTVPAAPDSSQSLENLMTWDGNCASGSQAQVFCGKNGRSATYVAPRGGNIKLTAASLLCDTLTLVADGGKGAAGQDGQKGSPCESARAGSGGKIEARFVNQTASVNAKASIGMFPKRSSGGAAGGGNCQGAQGGKGSITSQFGICYNNAAKCDGAAAPAPSGGNPGLSGSDPLALPGVANLTKGIITLDQLPSVDSLLPYYDQVQLDMILGEGNARYVAKDYTGAGDIFTFLTTLTTPCLSGSAGPRNCNDTFAQAGTSLQQMQQGFSFYGRPNNWVPLISAQTINDVIKPLLSALQTVENVYVKGYREKAKDKITKLELQEFISQSVGTSSKYEDQIAIATIATASVPNLIQIGDTLKKVSDAKSPAFIKENEKVAAGGVVACNVLGSVLKDGLSGFKSAKEDLATANQTDAFKNFVDNEEFENYIESFKTLPGYKTYGKQLKEYKNVCLAASAKALYSSFFEGAYDGLINNIRAYLYQAYQALTYTSLAVSSPADEGKIRDYAGLTAAFAAYQDAAVQALAKAGGEKQQFKEPTPDTTFVVTQDNALNWDEGLKTGRLSFLVPTSTPNFMRSRGLVTIDSVDIRYNGARTKSFFQTQTALYTTIVHEGTPIVKAKNCSDYQFVHDSTLVLHVYDIYSGKTTQPATFNGGGIFIKLSPYTAWTLDFSQSLVDIDFSRVTSISLAFTGEFAALDNRACIDARTNGNGILLVDPFAAATSDYSFGGILLDDGQLPFELPNYEGVAKIYALPLELPLNCTAGVNLPYPIPEQLLLGSVSLEAVAGSTAYAANFTITPEMGKKIPTLKGGYHVIVNVTSTSETDLYDDNVDACFTYKCGLF
ncbi:hypothetical protein WJX75_008963 [Coccomyxa subellipsoidea]|uniref:Uncharacterized protein n=1 Tax=Coccomyxa subellipsoidea TaxID=248742 RepID=A0ABR2Z1Y3_9CHLO